jgi:hypothetical protein
MCQEVELEYVAGALGLDAALLQVKPWNQEHFFQNKPHLELLTQGMRLSEAELELIGFSQFAAILEQDEDSQARKNLPGRAGENSCTGQPQPYTFNPVIMRDQRIDGRGPTYLRDSNVRHGDRGASFACGQQSWGIVTESDWGNSLVPQRQRSCTGAVEDVAERRNLGSTAEQGGRGRSQRLRHRRDRWNGGSRENSR